MDIHRKALIQFLLASLVGLAGVMGTLLLLSEEAGAGPLVQGQAGLPVSRIENIDLVQPRARSEALTLGLTGDDDPDLEVAKSASSDPVTAGEALTYTLTITNNGPLIGTGVLVTDTLPTGVTFVTAVAGQGSCNESGGTVVCTLGTLNNTATTVVTVVVDVAPSTRGTLTNVARVSANEPDETPGNNTYTETTSVSAVSALSLVKTDSSDPIVAGDILTYTLTSTNGGPSDATDVILTDILPAEVRFIIAAATQGSCDESGGIVTCTLGILGSGDIATGTVVVSVTNPIPGDTVVTNTAIIDSQETTPLPVTEATVVSAHGAAVSVMLTPTAASISAGQSIPYSLIATDTFGNSWDVTSSGQTAFNILGAGHGGYWTDNVYHSGNYGDWTVQGVYTETSALMNTASLTVLSPVLHLEKSDDPDLVEAGAYLAYTLTYSNTGNQMATGVVLTDVLDSNVSYVTASLTPAGGLPDAPFWSIGEIMTDEINQIQVTVAVAKPLTNGTILTNTAWLDSIQTAPLPATEETTVHSSPVLTITKADYPDPVNAGSALRYTLIITNSGNENATSVTVAEHYDPNVSFFSHSRPDIYSGGDVWTIPILPVDHAEIIDVYVEVTDGLFVGAILTNRVTLDSDQTTPVTITENTDVTTGSDLVVSKLDSPDNDVQAGAELMYVISYENYGPALAEDVVITETYDSLVTFDRASESPRNGTDNVWDIGDLSGGEGGNIIVWVDVDTPLTSGTVLTNLVTIDSNHTAPYVFTETTTVSSTTDLAFTVTDQPDPVEPGDPLIYTLAYMNTGNADATQVVITATLDPNVSYVNASLTPTGGADNVWYWEIDKIAGEDELGGFGSGQIVIQTSVTLPLTNGLKLDFAAQLADAEGDRRPIAAQTTVASTPVLSLRKSDGVATVYAGDLLTYTLTYTNSGTENAYDITITDTLPDHVSYVNCEIGEGDCQPVPPGDPGEGFFHIPVLVAQTSAQALLVVQVDDPLAAGTSSVVNRARMTHPSLAVPLDVQDTDAIGSRPDLIVTADHAPTLFSPGEPMIYTVTYGNAGQHMDAEDVSITTIRPPGTVPVSPDWQTSDGETYVYEAGDLPAGSTGHTVTFTVVHADQPEVGASVYNTPFTIAEKRGVGWDSISGNNATVVYIGVPDLIVTSFSVEPYPLEADVPVTFTVVVKNQGTGMAWNPDIQAGYYLDAFTAPVVSYPFERFGEIYVGLPPTIGPGTEYTLIITHSEDSVLPIQFSNQELRTIEAFYVKVDNFAFAVEDEQGRFQEWTQLWGLVPEYNEMNNVAGPIYPRPHRIYLPMITK
jgi:uncharacterized repeat protein (TIGR01451 family)